MYTAVNSLPPSDRSAYSARAKEASAQLPTGDKLIAFFFHGLMADIAGRPSYATGVASKPNGQTYRVRYATFGFEGPLERYL